LQKPDNFSDLGGHPQYVYRNYVRTFLFGCGFWIWKKEQIDRLRANNGILKAAAIVTGHLMMRWRISMKRV